METGEADKKLVSRLVRSSLSASSPANYSWGPVAPIVDLEPVAADATLMGRISLLSDSPRSVARLLQPWPQFAATMHMLVGSKIRWWIEFSLNIFWCGLQVLLGCKLAAQIVLSHRRS